MQIVDGILKDIDPNLSKNLCASAYDNGKRGGCFGVYEADDLAAATFYKTMLNKGFRTEHRMRQDYAIWGGVLATPTKNRTVIFNVSPVASASKETGHYYRARQLGYSSLVTVSLSDPDQ